MLELAPNTSFEGACPWPASACSSGTRSPARLHQAGCKRLLGAWADRRVGWVPSSQLNCVAVL